MKILFVIPEYPPTFGGGIGTFYGHLLPALAKQGASIHAVVGSALSHNFSPTHEGNITTEPLDRRLTENFKKSFHGFETAPDFSNFLAAAWAAWEQSRHGEGYDLIQTTDWGMLFAPWVLSKKPTVVRLHGSIGQIARWDSRPEHALSEHLCALVEHALLPHAGLLVTHAQSNCSYWQDALRRTVEHCAAPFPLESETKNQPRESHAVVVGRVQQWKGPERLCKALRLLGEQSPIVHWIGRSVETPLDGRPLDTYLAEKYPDIWHDKIIRHPPQTPETIVRWQETAAFTIVPSDWDMFNQTAIEAMARKTVVVCSTGAGVSDLIQHGKNGFLFETENHESLAACISRANALTSEEREAIGLAASATVDEKLNPEHIARLTLNQFRRTVQGNGSEGKIHPMSTILSPGICFEATKDSRRFIALDRLPLKHILRYTIRRAFKRVLGR